MVRVFNHWFSPRKAAYFFAEETVLVIALLAGASLGPVAAQATSAVGGPPMYPAVLRAAKADPRIAAGPVVLAAADVVTLLFYFGLGARLLG